MARNQSEQWFKTIVADPPWYEKGGGKIKRGADRHYPCMKTRDIIPLMQTVLFKHQPDPQGAHLYLWVTNNFLIDGLEVMRALGFRYVTKRTWAKDRFGLGYYYRGQTEDCLFGVMGKLPPVSKSMTTLIGGGIVKRGRHSAKPQVFYDEIEKVSPGPRLEIFARAPRSGWTVWGNESGADL